MKSVAIGIVIWTQVLLSISAFTAIPFQSKQCAKCASWSGSGQITLSTKKSWRIHTRSGKILYATPPFQWFFQKKDNNSEAAKPPFRWFFQEKDNNNEAAKEFTGESAKEAELMHRTAKIMEDHRRSQETAERTAAMMEELSSVQVVGKSKAGASGGIGIGGGDKRRGGVKVTFNGEQRPIGVEVDPNYLFSSSMSESQGIVSVDELNEAIIDALEDGYEQSGKLMEEKIKGLYGQLGLPREPPSLPSGQENTNRWK